MALTQISTDGIKNGTITNADLASNAAIAGTKISPDFGSQNIATSGTITTTGNALTIQGTHPDLIFTDTNNDDDFKIHLESGTLRIKSDTDNLDRFAINSNGLVGINTTTPEEQLHIRNSANCLVLLEDTQAANQVGVRYKTTTGQWIAGVHGGDGNRWKVTNSNTFGGGNDYLSIGTNASVDIAGFFNMTCVNPSIYFYDSVSNPDYRLYNNSGSFRLKDTTNGVERLLVNSTGQISTGGITNPTGVFCINTGSGTTQGNTLELRRSGSNDYHALSLFTGTTVDWSVGQNSLNAFEVYENGAASTTRLTILNGGNTGIGTRSPSEKLHVSGNIKATGSLTAGSASTLNGGATVGGNLTVNGVVLSQGTSGRGGIFGQIEVGYLGTYLTVQPASGYNDLHFNYDNGSTVQIGHTSGSTLTVNGAIRPKTDSASDLGLTGTRFRAAYVDTYYGDGSNLTGINTDLVSDTTPQLGGNLDTNSFEIDLDDGHGVRFNNAKYQIYTSGGNAYLQNTEGDLLINTVGSGDDIILTSNDDILLNPQAGENGIKILGNGAVELYHDNSKRFETTSGGGILTGHFSATQSASFGNTAIDPDSYTGSFSGGFGGISDGSGWSARGLFVHGAGTGDAAAIGHNGNNLYFGIQDGANPNSMETWLQVTPGSRVISFQTDDNNNNVRIGSNKIFHAGNDGAGSGLDADTLDGVQGANYVRTNQNTTITSDLFIGGGAGGLTVNGASDIRFTNGNWTGNVNGTAKIQHHNNYLYISGGTNGIIFRENNDDRWIIDGSGHFRPGANNTYDLGTTSQRVRNIYTNDLHLSNEGSSNDVDGTWGSYTIQEGAEDLFLVNKRNGKKYKFNLTEVS